MVLFTEQEYQIVTHALLSLNMKPRGLIRVAHNAVPVGKYAKLAITPRERLPYTIDHALYSEEIQLQILFVL